LLRCTQVSHVADTVAWLNGDESSRVFSDCWATAQVRVRAAGGPVAAAGDGLGGLLLS
jgi:hypothetical protein